MADTNYAALMDPATDEAKRGSFFFILMFSGIIVAAWCLARFLWGGLGVPAGLKFGFGTGLEVLMLASLVPYSAARRQLNQGNDAAALGGLTTLIFVSLIMMAGIVYGWRQLPIGTAFGGILDITTGWLLLYFIAGFLALLASLMKGKRVPERAKRERWVAHNVLTFWAALVAYWTVFYVIFYWA